MMVFKIIMAITSFLSMIYLAYKLDTYKRYDTYTALCITGISCFGIILGLMMGLIFNN